MAKKELVKATLESFMAKAIERKQTEVKFKDIEVPSLEMLVTFNKPSEELSLEVINELSQHDGDFEALAGVFADLIYKCCPMLKDIYTKQGSDKKYSTPTEVVVDLLTLSDRLAVGNELLEMTGLGGKDVKKKLKK
ncbi:hypothetical protein [Clostridium frigidicarnis]|uniref:Phage XkdN-like tail assembly chaperone protein, TAC n=1 Tax=Clostridium frigidicarnis TaxID=84698 RepID=A0A1I0V1C7_9CLOT|nr:hypothetical protein [Clostridium frigidicarnis]SFA70124.1 hypothetical protein SAMN04488528_100188 [Clostridium frigidicarnis]